MPDSEADATDRPSHPGKAKTGNKPCGTRQRALRRVLEYSAASTRVFSAKYNPILRKAFFGFAQGQQPGCGRQCKFSPQKKSYTRPAINHSPKSPQKTLRPEGKNMGAETSGRPSKGLLPIHAKAPSGKADIQEDAIKK